MNDPTALRMALGFVSLAVAVAVGFGPPVAITMYLADKGRGWIAVVLALPLIFIGAFVTFSTIKILAGLLRKLAWIP